MAGLRMATEAMATRFELVLEGGPERSLRAAGEEAFEEIHRLEASLSLYRPDSQIAALNRHGFDAPVPVTPEVFALIRHATLLSVATRGAFDITVGPLLRAWGLMRGGGSLASPEELREAREAVGYQHLILDEAGCRIGLARPGMIVDLGSVGKGYALDRAAGLLRDAGVTSALLHGGTSTAIGLGRDAEGRPWRIAIDVPEHAAVGGSRRGEEPLCVVELEDQSLSVSAVWGKGFEAGGRYYGHVMDPRRGEPVDGALLGAVVLPSATESDALSTALLVEGSALLQAWKNLPGGPRGIVVERGAAGEPLRVMRHGLGEA